MPVMMSVRCLHIRFFPGTILRFEVHGIVKEIESGFEVPVDELKAWMERIQRLKATQRFYLSVFPDEKEAVGSA